MDLFRRVGTRWEYSAMGGAPIGLRWEAIYPLVDLLELGKDEHIDMLDDLAAMEAEALATIREFAPKAKS